MPKFSGVLIACDFDDTLVYTTEALLKDETPPPVSEKNCDAIRHFMSEGGIFSMCTGRARPAFEPLYRGIPMNGPTILFNGAAIFDYSTQTYLKTAFLDENVRPCVQQVLDAFPNLATELYHDDNVIHTIHPNEITAHHTHITLAPAIPVNSLEDVPSPLSKALLEIDPAYQADVLSFIQAQSWFKDYEIVPSSTSLIEVTAKGASKGGMVQELANMLRIQKENLYCVGDHLNDLSMISLSRIPFAPANSVPDVLSFPGLHVLPDCREDAIAALIQELEEIYS